MTAAKAAVIPSPSTRDLFLALATTLLLTACAGGPTVKPQVLTPPPSAPRAEFVLEKIEVQSREVGEDAWQRNAQYGQVLGEALRAALRDQGKTLVAPPADTIRARVYLAYGKAPVKSKEKRQRAKPHIEVRLQLLEGGTSVVRYSTHTQAPIKASPFAGFGWGPDEDQVIREVMEQAAKDFVSRL